MSPLIVEATVISVFPAISRDPNIPGSIETHSLISVSAVLSGIIPGGSTTILLAQEGGKVGPLEILVPSDPLVRSGEHYLLFLAPDNRKQPPNTSGSPRYSAVGVWAGKVKSENEKVRFLPRSSQSFQELENTDASAFLTAVKAKINNTVVPSKRNVIPHPGIGIVTGK